MTKPGTSDRAAGPPSAGLEMADRAKWRAWLEAQHDISSGVWLQLEKGTADSRRLTYDDAVEEALCFGWIDGQVRRIDATRYVRWFAPRKPKSNWSQLNKRRLEVLTRQGLMTDAGLAAVELAKRTGSWTALDEVEALTVPDDLARALAGDPAAERNFAAFPASARKAYLYWVTSAKQAETRMRRIQDVVALSARNQKYRLPARSLGERSR